MASTARQRPGYSGEVSAPPQTFWRRVSTFLYRRPWLIMLLLLLPPMIWLGVVYLGSLIAMMVNSFYIYNSFTSKVTPGFTLANYAKLLAGSNPVIVLRSAGMAAAVTVACAALSFPVGYYMARYASKRVRSALYIAVLLPLWSSYIVRVYAWKTILANEGILNWFINNLGIGPIRDALLALPVVGGESMSVSLIGMFVVFVYVWLPYMILPVYTSLERVPQNVLDASADLGAKPLRTFWQVTLPLAIPGVVAGSIFTFSLTLGDYIIPSTLASTLFIGNVVERNLGANNNLPLAAAMTVVPMIVMFTYLAIARKTGAFDAL